MSADNIQKNLDTLRAKFQHKEFKQEYPELLYSQNITIKEVRDLLDIMEAHKQYTVGLHFFGGGGIMCPIVVGLHSIVNENPDERFDITDFESA